MENIKIALDWTANTNHIGFFIAKALDLYTAQGLDVTIITPDEDNYEITPVKKLELGEVDFALCPLESIISYQTKSNPFDVKAVATLLKEDMSAIVTLKENNITSPKELDSKSYASYNARYEDGIVTQMVLNDGGHGNVDFLYPQKLGIWETIVQKKSDATWVFLNWEAIQAEAEGVQLDIFRMRDYNIPYSYSPVIAASQQKIKEKKESYKKFLAATKKGFLRAKENHHEAAEILSPFISNNDKNIDLVKSLQYISPYFGNFIDWGVMHSLEVDRFLQWIHEKNMEQRLLSSSDVATHALL
ncbi:ABC transporter substrate-binding protein [Aquimarina algicola]|uniref:Thiamine pyrimidine synthase n=1 Tax=Aquimarina algicola TaxID=2589995 RepID=A0A504J2N1_9FLAO|nr:ABC transporter substrate-binding protein [Aquimarina algicola]TPN85117.1 ABC transporter substrate-binding protein [Aquimarina algicola]